MMNDFRIALRILWRARLFAFVAVISLGAGTAACVLAISTFISQARNEQALPPSDRLVHLLASDGPPCTRCPDTFSRDEALYWQEIRLRGVQRVATYSSVQIPVVSGASRDAETVAFVDSGFFPLLNTTVQAGRLLGPDDFEENRTVAAVVTSWYAREYYGSGPRALGSRLTIGGNEYTVVGVLPAYVNYPSGVAVWLPIGRTLHVPARAENAFQFLGVLRSSADLSGIRAQLARVAGPSGFVPDVSTSATAADRAEKRMQVLTEAELGASSTASYLGLAAAVVAFTFLVACLNIGVLFVTRILARDREFAVRTALGASAVELLRPVACELTILGISSFGLAIGGAVLSAHVVMKMLREQFRIVADAHIDVLAVGVAALLIIIELGALLAVIAPGVRSRRNLATLRSGSSITSGRPRVVGRTIAMIFQLAAICVLLTGAILFARSYSNVQNIDLGFDADHLFVTSLENRELGSLTSSTESAGVLAEQLATLSGVQSSAIWTTSTTSRPRRSDPRVTLEDRGELIPDWSKPRRAPMLAVDGTADLLSALGISLLDGRSFTPIEVSLGSPVVILNDLAAARLWPGERAIGKRLKLGGEASTEPWLTVIGVASSSALILPLGLSMSAVNGVPHVPIMFRPLHAGSGSLLYVGVRADHMTSRLEFQINHELSSLLGEPVSATPRSFRSLMNADQHVAKIRIVELLIGTVSLVGLALSCLGIYGLVSEIVRRRIPEFGIRVALGARSWSVVRLVLSNVMTVSCAGLAVGAAGSAALAVFLRSMLYGSQPRPGMRTGFLFGVGLSDPRSFAVAAFVLLVIVLAAALQPAWRAARADPMLSLRSD